MTVFGTQVLFSIWDTRSEDFEAFREQYWVTMRVRLFGGGRLEKIPASTTGRPARVVNVSWEMRRNSVGG